MYDRIPSPGKENRVSITQDNGQVITGVLAYADDATQEGSTYTKGNVLPDSVLSLIGLPTESSEPADMFNVLATVGDLYVWRRTQDVGSGGYKLVNAGQQLITGTLQSADQSQTINYSDSITVTEESISLSGSVSSVGVSYNSYENANVLKGKFFQNPSAGNIIYYAPEDTVFNRASNPGPTYNVYATSLSTPEYVPPGTYTDYPVSVNPNAYQAGSDAQPAGYTLGEVQIGSFALTNKKSNDAYVEIALGSSSEIQVNQETGELSFTNPSFSKIYGGTLNESTAPDYFLGKFLIYRSGSGIDFSPGKMYYIPEDASITMVKESNYKFYWASNKYQTVTGYPAIPAGTAIEYLGKLGNDKILNGSYVGTGTKSVVFSVNTTLKKSLLVIYNTNGGSVAVAAIYPGASNKRICFSVDSLNDSSGSITPHSIYTSSKSITLKPPSGYSTSLNKSGVTYNYQIIGI